MWMTNQIFRRFAAPSRGCGESFRHRRSWCPYQARFPHASGFAGSRLLLKLLIVEVCDSDVSQGRGHAMVIGVLLMQGYLVWVKSHLWCLYSFPLTLKWYSGPKQPAAKCVCIHLLRASTAGSRWQFIRRRTPCPPQMLHAVNKFPYACVWSSPLR